MFGLFSKPSGIKVIDKVWMTTEAKVVACSSMLEGNPNYLFVTWFHDSLETLKTILNDDSCCHVTDPIMMKSKDKSVIFFEHYPMSRLEQEVFQRLGLKEAIVLSALDEPLFELFGGARLTRMMEQMGMEEDEVIEHSMVSASIGRAQKKIAEKVNNEKAARSAKEWFALNMNA